MTTTSAPRIAIFSLLALMGCAATADEPASNTGVQDGLTVLKADPAWGANFSFRSRGRTLLLQTRVGADRQPTFQGPGVPMHEMDVRVLDQQGMTFILVRGGDGYADRAWLKEIAAEKGFESPTVEERETELRMLIEDLPAALATLGPSLKDDRYMLAGLAEHTSLDQLKRPDPKDGNVASGKPTTEATTTATGEGDQPYWTLRTTNNGCWSNLIYADRATCRGCINGFDHTSVTLSNYNGCRGVRDEWIYAMNHSGWGTYGSYEGWVGSSWNSWDLLGQINWEGSETTNRYGGCSTGYYLGASQGHVCNDDAAYELWQVYDASWSDWGQCRYGGSWSYHAGPHSCDWWANRPSWWEPTTKWQAPKLPPNL